MGLYLVVCPLVIHSKVQTNREGTHPRLMYDAMKGKYKEIEVEADPKLMPASFLIAPDGVVKMAHYGDHPIIETMLEFTK